MRGSSLIKGYVVGLAYASVVQGLEVRLRLREPRMRSARCAATLSCVEIPTRQ